MYLILLLLYMPCKFHYYYYYKDPLVAMAESRKSVFNFKLFMIFELRICVDVSALEIDVALWYRQ